MDVLIFLIDLLVILVFVSALLSWLVPPTRSNPVVRLLRGITEPLLRPVRAVMPNFGGVDVSPIVVILLLELLRYLLLSAG